MIKSSPNSHSTMLSKCFPFIGRPRSQSSGTIIGSGGDGARGGGAGAGAEDRRRRSKTLSAPEKAAAGAATTTSGTDSAGMDDGEFDDMHSVISLRDAPQGHSRFHSVRSSFGGAAGGGGGGGGDGAHYRSSVEELVSDGMANLEGLSVGEKQLVHRLVSMRQASAMTKEIARWVVCVFERGGGGRG